MGLDRPAWLFKYHDTHPNTVPLTDVLYANTAMQAPPPSSSKKKKDNPTPSRVDSGRVTKEDRALFKNVASPITKELFHLRESIESLRTRQDGPPPCHCQHTVVPQPVVQQVQQPIAPAPAPHAPANYNQELYNAYQKALDDLQKAMLERNEWHNKYSEAQSRTQQAETNMQRAEEDLRRAKDDLSHESAELRRERKEVSRLREELHHARSQASSGHSGPDPQMTYKLAELEASLAEARAEAKRSAKHQEGSTQVSEAEVSWLRREVEQLGQRLKTQMDENDSLRRQISPSAMGTVSTVDMEKISKVHTEQTIELQNKNSGLTRKYSRLKMKYEELASEYNRLKRHRKDENARYEDMKAEYTKLKRHRAEWERELTVLRKEHHDVTKKLQEAMSTINVLQREIGHREQTVKNSVALHQQVDELNARIVRMTVTLDQWKLSHQQQQEVIAQLTAQIAEGGGGGGGNGSAIDTAVIEDTKQWIDSVRNLYQMKMRLDTKTSPRHHSPRGEYAHRSSGTPASPRSAGRSGSDRSRERGYRDDRRVSQSSRHGRRGSR